MSNLVPAEDIERIVGTRRDPVKHLGRAVSAEETFYILHSQACLDSGRDLRECPYSLALDRGIAGNRWADFYDRPGVRLYVEWGRLVPYADSHRIEVE